MSIESYLFIFESEFFPHADGVGRQGTNSNCTSKACEELAVREARPYLGCGNAFVGLCFASFRLHWWLAYMQANGKQYAHFILFRLLLTLHIGVYVFFSHNILTSNCHEFEVLFCLLWCPVYQLLPQINFFCTKLVRFDNCVPSLVQRVPSYLVYSFHSTEILLGLHRSCMTQTEDIFDSVGH